jgi:hypothetical protein
MVGVKLPMPELVRGWLAVSIMTLGAIFSLLGVLIVSYFDEEVRAHSQ